LWYVKVWREDLRWDTVPEEVWSQSALPVGAALMKSFGLCSFGQLYLIIICGELCFMLSCLGIDQRNYQRSEVCFLLVPMYFWIFSTHALLVEYNVVNNLVVTREKLWIHDLNDNSISLYWLEGRSPQAGNHDNLLQVGAKYLGCVVCRFHVAAGAGSAPCQKPVRINL
jgi:hypothetical protein